MLLHFSDETVDPLCGNQLNSGVYMAIFMCAQFVTAMGGVTLQVVAIPMLDENIKSKQLPLYQGKSCDLSILKCKYLLPKILKIRVHNVIKTLSVVQDLSDSLSFEL